MSHWKIKAINPCIDGLIFKVVAPHQTTCQFNTWLPIPFLPDVHSTPLHTLPIHVLATLSKMDGWMPSSFFPSVFVIFFSEISSVLTGQDACFVFVCYHCFRMMSTCKRAHMISSRSLKHFSCSNCFCFWLHYSQTLLATAFNARLHIPLFLWGRGFLKYLHRLVSPSIRPLFFGRINICQFC